MNVAFGVEVDVRCLTCGAAQDLPDRADRVLEGDKAFADVHADDACACGGRRFSVEPVVTPTS